MFRLFASIALGVSLSMAVPSAGAGFGWTPYRLDSSSELPSREQAYKYLLTHISPGHRFTCDLGSDGVTMFKGKPFATVRLKDRVPFDAVTYLALENNGKLSLKLVSPHDVVKEFCDLTGGVSVRRWPR